MNARTLCSLLAAMAVSACSDAGDPREYAKQVAKEQRTPRPESKIIKIQTPVPPRAKVACDKWIDVAAFTASMEQEETMTLEDKSASEVEPTSICSLKRAGEAPDEKAQEKAFLKQDMKLGVLPGDELCLVHLFCGAVSTEDGLRDKCSKDPMQSLSTELGQTACVRRSQRAAEWAYKYSVIDPETTCTLEVQGGPSVTDEAIVQACTRAALVSLTKDGIASHEL